MQTAIERAINTIVQEFIRTPYRFFTEADAVIRFVHLLGQGADQNTWVETADGYKTGLIHCEYPTFFRFDDKNPLERLGPPARRGHYDVVVLDPAFIKAQPAETVLNRNIRFIPECKSPPLQAAIEFKLHTRGWSKGRTAGVCCELGKLALSSPEAPLRYLVTLQRYNQTSMHCWNTYWPIIKNAASRHADIRSVFAIHWSALNKTPAICRFGPWLEGREA